MTSFLRFKVPEDKFETPLTIRQVETHLAFGPLSRHLPVAYLAPIFVLIWVGIQYSNTVVPRAERIADAIWNLFVFGGLLPLTLSRMTRRQQAIVAWGSTKFAMGFGAFLMMTVGAGSSYQRNQSDALPNFFLGLIWLPSLEFIPRITPYQKYVTIGRLLLSIPCVYFGVRSGYWHWGSA